MSWRHRADHQSNLSLSLSLVARKSICAISLARTYLAPQNQTISQNIEYMISTTTTNSPIIMGMHVLGQDKRGWLDYVSNFIKHSLYHQHNIYICSPMIHLSIPSQSVSNVNDIIYKSTSPAVMRMISNASLRNRFQWVKTNQYCLI